MKTGKMILTIIVSVVFLLLASVAQELAMRLLSAVGIPAWLYHIAGGFLYAVSAYLLVRLYCVKVLKEELTEFCIPRCRIQIKWAVAAALLPAQSPCFICFFREVTRVIRWIQG